MNRMKKYVWWISLLVMSCSDTSPVFSGKAYFPLAMNRYWDYAVNETDILETTICGDGGQIVKTYQLRLLISDSLKNNSGGYTYTIHRYTRQDESSPWSELDTWTARISNNSVIEEEGNTSYVKLIFPFGDSTKWNGNLYNNFAAQNYYITSIGKSFNLDNTSYPQTITVYQSNYNDFFINVDKRSEVYAYNVGLVYKKIDQRTFFLDPCYGQQKVQKGLLLEQSLIGYGKL